ncbi:MAG: radical SAM protein [Candidatus Lokiarchaeota archaeon]|nr:radical SAM protein [Candidatus Lokiarchaeota archaeon]MBD3339291.1 radical SAM protein [Candidatus Lokiarchaeota archaeon]
MKIEKIRVSIGSASVLGLKEVKFDVAPTTCYIMTYREGHCTANCGFCPQARDANSSAEKLSRITWPIFNFKDFLTKLKYATALKRFERICVQTLNYPKFYEDLIQIVSAIKKISNIPISTAITPISKKHLSELKIAGVERVAIALDGVTQEIFDRIKGKDVKGPYQWELHFQSIKNALEVFSEGYVSTHLIIGLGETHREVLKLIEKFHHKQVLPALFSFMPIKGTELQDLSQPDLIDYRLIQLSRYLIIYDNKTLNDFTFNSKGQIIKIKMTRAKLQEIINYRTPFLTSGCPGCNRPYYTSKPSGPIYNFPRELNKEEKTEISNLLIKYVN